MGIETVLFKSEEKKTKGEIADTLRTIADKIDKGNLVLKQDSTDIAPEFPAQMVLDLKVEEEQGKNFKRSLEIELEWIVGDVSSSATQIL